MSKIFDDDGRMVRIDESDGSIQIFLQGVRDIFPALHYFESHPESRDKKILVRQSDKEINGIDGQEIETFYPQLVRDDRGRADGYKNYNFILLNSELSHSVYELVTGFANFLSQIENPGRKKVKIKDVNPESFPSLLRTANGKKETGKGDFCYSLSGGTKSPSAMFLYAERFSPGLRNRMGLTGRFPDSVLETRLYI